MAGSNWSFASFLSPLLEVIMNGDSPSQVDRELALGSLVLSFTLLPPGRQEHQAPI